MKSRFITAALLIGAVAVSSSCVVRVNGTRLRDELGLDGKNIVIDVDGSEQEVREVALEEFDEISTKGPIDVYFFYSEESKAEVRAQKSVIDLIKVEQSGRTVTIGTENNVRIVNHGNGIRVNVYSPSVKEIALAGSGSINAERIDEDCFKAALAGSGDINIDALTASKADLSVAGSGDVKVRVDAAQVEAAVAGSGDIVISGKADKLDAAVAGAGDIDIRNLECDSVSTSVKGAGKVRR